MFQNSTLFGTIYFLVKTAQKVRGSGKILRILCPIWG
jgi:hypothetical protein